MWQFVTCFFLLFSLSLADDAAEQEFITANNLFAQSLYKEIAHGKNENLLVSPFSAEAVLALTQFGSRGKTAEELQSGLHLPKDSTKFESGVKSLLPKLKENKLYTLTSANKIYIKENFSIKDDFKTVATSVFQADVENVDFTKTVETATKINNWVEQHTNNKIKNLLSSNDLNDQTRAILINALYLKANWSNPFPLLTTELRKFYRTPSDTVEVKTLNHYREYFKYYECPHLEAQFLELPFNGDEASLTVVLPNKKDGLAALENQLEQVFFPQHKLEATYLNVALPKFRIDSLIDIKGVLQQLGVSKIFSEKEADLSGVAGDPGDLFVQKVVQKTFIDVSEEGVEAAAATIVLVAVPVSAFIDIPKNFIADHPFIFYIKVKGVIIFVGKLTDPSKG